MTRSLSKHEAREDLPRFFGINRVAAEVFVLLFEFWGCGAALSVERV